MAKCSQSLNLQRVYKDPLSSFKFLKFDMFHHKEFGKSNAELQNTVEDQTQVHPTPKYQKAT